MLNRKRGADGKLLLLKNSPEDFATRLPENVFRYRDADLVVASFCAPVSSAQASVSGASATSLDYYDDVSVKANSDLAELNAIKEPFKHFFF